MRRSLIVAWLLVLIWGCAGGGEPSPKGPPIIFHITSTPIGGNADPTPFDTVTMTKIESFEDSVGSPPFLSIRVYFKGQDVVRYRHFTAVLPVEAKLTPGSSFSFGTGNTFSIGDLLIEPGDVLDERIWGLPVGTLTVTSNEGRVVTLAVDALCQPGGEATGQLRIQGTITLDFSQQIEPPAD